MRPVLFSARRGEGGSEEGVPWHGMAWHTRLFTMGANFAQPTFVAVGVRFGTSLLGLHVAVVRVQATHTVAR